MQQHFLENFALQCGFCTPGMLITAIELLRDNPEPTEHEVREAHVRQSLPLQRLSGHCRRRAGSGAQGAGVMSDARFVNQRMVGSSVIPDEAMPLVEGDGRFLNDIKLPGMYHVAFLRSQHAHARLKSVDASEARACPASSRC